MEFYVGCDSHRRYSVFVVMDEKGQATKPVRVEHDRGKLREFLQSLPPRSQVAIESSGGWYWLVDEIEAAGLRPQLAHSYDAKQRMAGRNKTDKFDARGLALELLTGTLPAIWIPPADVRDLRGLMRTRLALQAQSTQVKNRVSAAINRYGLKEPNENRDLFAQRHRSSLNRYIQTLPAATQQATKQELALVDEIRNHVEELDKQIHKQVGPLQEMRLLRTVPGIGRILGATVLLEVGSVDRFPSAAHMASYAGLVPVVHSSGGKTWQGKVPKNANLFLKWAFVEAANCIVAQQHRLNSTHVMELYQRLRSAKGHGKAAVAVARHLAEASWWVLSKQQPYSEPKRARISSSTHG
jgi:transposase